MDDISLESDDPGAYIDIISASLFFYSSNLVILLLLLMLSALVSGSEVAYFSISSDKKNELMSSNRSVDKKIWRLLEKPKKLLATILIFNNLVNVSIVIISSYLAWELAGTSQSDGSIIAVLTAIITIAIVFFGEILPKVYANQRNVGFARFTAPIMVVAEWIFSPFSHLLIAFSNIVEKRVQRKGYSISVDTLNHALEVTAGKETSDEEKVMLKGIVNFGTISVKQIMHSRMDIIAFSYEMDFHELMDRINKSGFSRVPVYKDTIDKIEGILYIKDLLPFLDEDEKFEWQRLLRPSYFVPESKKIDDLLKDFQERRVHMAIVVDEYGGTSGLVTMEDILEEIVGEINDEFDEEEMNFTKLDNDTFIFEGKVSLNDFCKIIDIEPDVFDEVKGESESLGGLLLEINSDLPKKGDKIQFSNFSFIIESVDKKRIKKIKVIIEQKNEIGQDAEG
ncbi:gliding motility-associated protein GldE [Cytophagaceae bacterium ABcell3]|nr:gliding motility-associated protein GldE [Cytophagaceae bacterium ABcell3]